MAWYRTGTVTVSNGSNVVTGTGTQWAGNVHVGDTIVLGSPPQLYEVANVASNTTIALVTNYSGTSGSGQEYFIAPTQGWIKELADRAAAVISSYSNIQQAVDDLEQLATLISQADAQAGTRTDVQGWSSLRVRQAADAAIDDRTESGSFTPTVSGGDTAGTCTYTVRTGSYTLTDSVYTFKLDVGWSDHTGSGIIVVSGLPFSSTASATPVICWKHPTMAVGIVPSAYVGSAGSAIYVEGFSLSGAATAVNVEAAGRLMISGTVQV